MQKVTIADRFIKNSTFEAHAPQEIPLGCKKQNYSSVFKVRRNDFIFCSNEEDGTFYESINLGIQ